MNARQHGYLSWTILKKPIDICGKRIELLGQISSYMIYDISRFLYGLQYIIYIYNHYYVNQNYRSTQWVSSIVYINLKFLFLSLTQKLDRMKYHHYSCTCILDKSIQIDITHVYSNACMCVYIIIFGCTITNSNRFMFNFIIWTGTGTFHLNRYFWFNVVLRSKMRLVFGSNVNWWDSHISEYPQKMRSTQNTQLYLFVIMY